MYTETQIRAAGISGEISSIDVEHLISILKRENKVSDISVHNFLEEKLCDHEDESGKFYRGDTVIHLLQEYASIVNEREDNIPADFKEVTGQDSPKEMMAYEKGREDEQQVIIEWIEKWDGSSNSVMGALLKKKFNERKDNLGDADLHILKQIRNYFGENDAPIFNQTAFSVIDRIIKSQLKIKQNDNLV